MKRLERRHTSNYILFYTSEEFYFEGREGYKLYEGMAPARKGICCSFYFSTRFLT